MDEVPSRQIQAAVARVNKENISHHLSEATHKNKTDAVREQQRRSATQQWLSGNTLAAAVAAAGIPDRTPEADVLSSRATTGESDNELSVERYRTFRSILDAAEAHNQSEDEAFDGAALTAEQQQAIHDEENRTYHMLREHGARRLKTRMLPEDYAQFMSKL